MALSDFMNEAARFDSRGRLDNPAALNAFTERLGQGHRQDLLVLSHGWNNDEPAARQLYDTLLSSLLTVASDQGDSSVADRLAVLAVYWPSRQFSFDFDELLQRGGAAAAGPRGAARSLLDALLGDLRTLCDSDAERAGVDRALTLTENLEDLRSAQDAFVAALLPLAADTDDAGAGDALPPGGDRLAGRDVLDRLGRPLPAAPEREGEIAGGAAGLGDLLGGIGRGAATFLNLLTFWKMKKRAGTIGQDGLAPQLDRLRQSLADTRPALRLHLAGHSFGARLVTAAVSRLAAPATSLTLLQGAFSHHGFAENFRGDRDGAFRSVIDGARVSGPIVVSHTRNDRAVGLAYPLASRLSRDDASALGGPGDRFGGLGSNGAVRTAEADALTMEDAAHRYQFPAGRISNLRADDHVRKHSDVGNPAVANALHAAMRAPEPA
jgi:hypothetical protein